MVTLKITVKPWLESSVPYALAKGPIFCRGCWGASEPIALDPFQDRAVYSEECPTEVVTAVPTLRQPCQGNTLLIFLDRDIPREPGFRSHRRRDSKEKFTL